jgi:hypothetical protein
MLRVARVIGPRERDDAGLHEAGEVVDVAAGLVFDDPVPQPDDDAHSQVVAQISFDLGLRESRIAIRIQQALFGDESGTLAVHMNRAAFVDERRAITRAAFDLEHLLRDLVVLVPREVQTAREAAPGVEAPVNAAPRSRLAGDERRSDVAHPGVVVRDLDDPDRRGKQRARVLIERG